MSQHSPQMQAPRIEGCTVAVVAARWNSLFTLPLAEQAGKRLGELGAEVLSYEVPGALELTWAASQLIEAEVADAVVVIGCVVRGDTPHFEYVCQGVTAGVAALNADCDVPVIFGVLTVNNDEQARQRVEARKGAEWADTAAAMINFKRRLTDELDRCENY